MHGSGGDKEKENNIIAAKIDVQDVDVDVDAAESIFENTIHFQPSTDSNVDMPRLLIMTLLKSHVAFRGWEVEPVFQIQHLRLSY